MPTGIPSNQLTDDEKRAAYLVILAAFVNGTVPDMVNRDDLFRAYYKLAAQVDKVSPKRTYKKKAVKKVKEDTK